VLDALVRGVYSYRSFVTWNDGDPQAVRGGYVTDTLSDATLGAIRRFEGKDDRPWFTWVAHVGPHNSRALRCSGGRCWGPPRPADRDLGDFRGVTSPSRRDAAWNRRNGASKPPFLRDLERQRARVVDRLFQRRIESLQSVDRAVGAAIRELRRSDELSDTLVMFTSDHGYLLGQYRYLGKRLPYEESVRVPLLVRGPGVRAGVHTDQLTTTADLSRTIVEAADATPPYELDGVSMLPVLRGAETSGRTATVLQTGAAVEYEGDRTALEEPADRGWLYRGYRDDRWTYVRYPDPSGAETPAFEELYDRARDPQLLHNLAQQPDHAGVLAEARDRAQALEACSGSGCHPSWAPIPRPG
jgi:arylsulfatase A-like enzyme